MAVTNYGGDELSGPVVSAATARKRGREERGNDEVLTARPSGCSAGSGEVRCRRNGGDDLGGPRLKKTAWPAFEGIRRGVAR